MEERKGISASIVNKYFTIEDARRLVGDVSELTEEQKTREILFKFGLLGYLNDEQFSASMEMPHIQEEIIGSILENLTLSELAERTNHTRVIDSRTVDLLDDFWVKHLTEEQEEVLSNYPENYIQLSYVIGDLYRYPEIFEEYEASDVVRDVLQVDKIKEEDRSSISTVLYSRIGRDKLLLDPRMEEVFDWISSTKEKVHKVEEEESGKRDPVYLPDLEYETVLSPKGYNEGTYEEEQELKKSLAEGSKSFIYGITETFHPELVSAWPRGSSQFQKYLQTLGKEDTETYYHVTPMKNLELISQEGLIRGKPSSMSGFLGYRKRVGVYVIDHDDDALQSLLQEAKRLKRNVSSWAILEVEIPSDCYMTVDPKMHSKAWIAFCDVPPSGIKFIQEVSKADILLDSEGEFSREF